MIDVSRKELGKKEQSADDFRQELEILINKANVENGSNTPDFLLAEYLMDCLRAFDKATRSRDMWYGIKLAPGMPNDLNKIRLYPDTDNV